MNDSISVKTIDYLELTQDELKQCFDKALRNYHTVEARTIWGLIDKELKEKRKDYLRILFAEEKYSEIKIYTTRYGVSMPFREQLMVYAYSGDVEAFVECYRGGKTNQWYFGWLCAVLCNNCHNMTEQQLNVIIKDFNSYKYTTEADTYYSDLRDYLNNGLFLIAHLWDVVLDRVRYDDVLFDVARKTIYRAELKYTRILDVFYMQILPIGDDIGKESVEKLIDVVEPTFLRGKKDIRIIVEFFFHVFDLHLDERAISYTKEYMEFFKAQYNKLQKKGEDYLVEEIRKLYIRSYNDSIITYGVADKKLGDFLIYLGVSDIPSDKQIEISRITDGLSFKGRIAYESAYKLFMLIMEGKYGLNDAGPVSLAFYRIIESESSYRIWRPLINKIGKETLIKKAEEQLMTIKNNKKADTYRRKWIGTEEKRGALEELYEKTKDEKGLMLGDLWFYTEFIRNNYSKDKVASLLYTEMKNVLTDNGLEAFISGKISNLYSRENREKYRNPPAHNTYLSIEVLYECKSYVETQLVNLSDWCKYREYVQ